MIVRRTFLTGLAVSGLVPSIGWGAVGAPHFLSAARGKQGEYWLVGLNSHGVTCFQVRLPERGHAAAAHPKRAEAVAFARRPGNFARVIDCRTGHSIAELTAPKGRHFYGHGVFSADGAALFTTENDLNSGKGIVGVWSVDEGYIREAEFSSGGIGPHDLALMPDGESLIIANGGIETHPSSGRSKLNIPFMQPNLTYLDLEGQMIETMELPTGLTKNSIRHLAVRPDGIVAFAMQWQGDQSQHPPLLGLHKSGSDLQFLAAPKKHQRQMEGYAGSVAVNGLNQVAITSPRGGCLHRFNSRTGAFIGSILAPDICGIAAFEHGFAFTTGSGNFGTVTSDGKVQMSQTSLSLDNHLLAINPCGLPDVSTPGPDLRFRKRRVSGSS